MNDVDLRRLADAAARLLRPHLARSAALRETIHLIGKWLCEEAGAASPDGAREAHAREPDDRPLPEPADSREVDSGQKVAVAARGPYALPSTRGVVPLTLGDAVVHMPLRGTTEEIGRARRAAVKSPPQGEARTMVAPRDSDVDLSVVEVRCRLKAASCRLFVEKRATEEASEAYDDIIRRMNEMIVQAKALPNCFLWVFWRERTPPPDASLAQIAENYDALADAALLMRRVDDIGDGKRSAEETDALDLLAEADSALRVALLDSWLESDDRDQQDVHFWLRDESRLRQLFINRHMTIADPADPGNAADLRDRIRQIHARLDRLERRTKSINSSLNRIRYHAGQLARNGFGDESDHWAKIAGSVADATRWGIAPTDRRLAQALGSEAAAKWSDDAPGDQALRTVVERAKALSADEAQVAEADAPSEPRAWSDSVLAAREWLHGRRLVVIGGEPRPDAVERLTDAFQLGAAEWVPLTEHGSSEPIRAPIFRPDTAVVVVIIKLAGHLQADVARRTAAEAGVPCVLVSGGYNPERVAMEILSQASVRLQGQAAPAMIRRLNGTD